MCLSYRPASQAHRLSKSRKKLVFTSFGDQVGTISICVVMSLLHRSLALTIAYLIKECYERSFVTLD